MQSSNIPSKIPVPFANSASSPYVNTIPVTSQIGITNGRASLADGFPPLNFTPIASGGVPPFGGDMNGILKEITAIQQWQEAGGFFTYDSAFSTVIGGYPKGSVLQSSSFKGLWISTAENNTTDPDGSSSAGWTSLAFDGGIGIVLTGGTYNASLYQTAFPILLISGTLTSNATLNVPADTGEWIVQNNTTGAFTVTIKTASGTGVTVTQGTSTYVYCDGTNVNFADGAKVASFNGRTGTVTLNSLDVTNALGYIPLQYGVGVNQTWIDYSGIRAAGINYYNGLGYPITVNATAGNAYGPAWVYCYVDGVQIMLQGSGSSGFSHFSNGMFVVPTGSTYRIETYNAASLSWFELK